MVTAVVFCFLESCIDWSLVGACSFSVACLHMRVPQLCLVRGFVLVKIILKITWDWSEIVHLYVPVVKLWTSSVSLYSETSWGKKK